MKKEWVIIMGTLATHLSLTVVAYADNQQTVASEKSKRDADSPEAMYNDIIDRANKAGGASEKIPFIGRFLPGYKAGSKASRQILEGSKFDE